MPLVFILVVLATLPILLGLLVNREWPPARCAARICARHDTCNLGCGCQGRQAVRAGGGICVSGPGCVRVEACRARDSDSRYACRGIAAGVYIVLFYGEETQEVRHVHMMHMPPDHSSTGNYRVLGVARSPSSVGASRVASKSSAAYGAGGASAEHGAPRRGGDEAKEAPERGVHREAESDRLKGNHSRRPRPVLAEHGS